MPYIKEVRRQQLNNKKLMDLFYEDLTVGDMNYIVSKLLVTELRGHVNYEHINAVIGVLECAKLELYRRQAAGYEDKKIKENGDI